MKKGFTIVELLLVICIIMVLIGIVVTAASGSVKAARGRRTDALCTLVQAGLAAYYAQYDEWPIDFKGKTRSNNEGGNNQSDDDKYVLTASEVQTCVKALVEAAKAGNPLIDVSGLWVSRQSGESLSQRAVGMNFMDAIHGTKKSKDKMKVAQMYFGYPDPSTGYFLRFKMVYSVSTDQLSVGQR